MGTRWFQVWYARSTVGITCSVPCPRSAEMPRQGVPTASARLLSSCAPTVSTTCACATAVQPQTSPMSCMHLQAAGQCHRHCLFVANSQPKRPAWHCAQGGQGCSRNSICSACND